MKQFEKDYYQQLVDKLYKEFQENLDSSIVCGIDKEVLCRDIASRAYYCSFLHCRQNIPLSLRSKKGGTHENIIDELGDYYKSILNRMKSHRIKADYKLANFNTHEKLLKKIIDDMKNVLEASSHDLVNKE